MQHLKQFERQDRRQNKRNFPRALVQGHGREHDFANGRRIFVFILYATRQGVSFSPSAALFGLVPLESQSSIENTESE